MRIKGMPWISLFKLIRKRSFWLILLFLGQMLTITAMDYFSDEVEKVLALALFVPLIISSGGNTGSQAAMICISNEFGATNNG